MKVKIKRIDTSLPLPQYETPGAVAFDLAAREDVEIKARGIGRIPSNVVMEIPEGYMLLIKDRSSTIKKKGLLITAGIIDRDYCGDDDEILIQFYNPGESRVIIERGERLAQGIMVPVARAEWDEVQEMGNPSRGGFGSTDSRPDEPEKQFSEAGKQPQKKGRQKLSYDRAGTLIVLDGTDGSGKRTQSERLVEQLIAHGYDAILIDFPQYGQKSAGLIENYLNGKYGLAHDVDPFIASFFYALDRFDARTQLQEWLDQGKVIVSNRYTSASMGHQGGKLDSPERRKAYFEWLTHYEYSVFGIPEPDINFVLHVPAATAQKLIAKKESREYLNGKTHDIHEDDINHLIRAEETYLEMCSVLPNFELISCVEGDRLLSIDEIHRRVWGQVERVLLFSES